MCVCAKRGTQDERKEESDCRDREAAALEGGRETWRTCRWRRSGGSVSVRPLSALETDVNRASTREDRVGVARVLEAASEGERLNGR